MARGCTGWSVALAAACFGLGDFSLQRRVRHLIPRLWEFAVGNTLNFHPFILLLLSLLPAHPPFSLSLCFSNIELNPQVMTFTFVILIVPLWCPLFLMTVAVSEAFVSGLSSHLWNISGQCDLSGQSC